MRWAEGSPSLLSEKGLKMSKLRFCRTVLIASAVLIVVSSSLASVRKEIEAVYAKWTKAVMAKDIKGAMSFLDPTFHDIDVDGNTADYGEVEKHMNSLFKTLKDLKVKIVIDEVHPSGNEAFVWITMTVSFRPSGSDKSQSFTAKFVESLRKTDAGWKFFLSQHLPPG